MTASTETKVKVVCPDCKSDDIEKGAHGYQFSCLGCGTVFDEESPEDGTAAEPRISDDVAEAIFQAHSDVQEKQQAFDEADRLRKGCKAALEESQEYLNGVVQQAKTGYGPLFTKPEDEKPAEEEWQTIPLAELDEPGLKPGTLAKLAKADIETVGDVAGWQAKEGLYLTAIEGIGPAAVQEINDALMALWERRDMLDPRLPAEDDGETEPSEGDASEAA